MAGSKMLLRGGILGGRGSIIKWQSPLSPRLNFIASRILSSENSGKSDGKVKRAHVTYRSHKRIVPFTNVPNLQQNFLNIFSDAIEGDAKYSAKVFVFQRFDKAFEDFVDLTAKDELRDKEKVEVKLKQDILPYNDQEEDIDLNFSQGGLKLHLHCRRHYNPWINDYVPMSHVLHNGEKYKLWSMASTEGDSYLSLDEDQEGKTFLQANGNKDSASVVLSSYSGFYECKPVCRLVFMINEEMVYVAKVTNKDYPDTCLEADKIKEKSVLEIWNKHYENQMFWEHTYPEISPDSRTSKLLHHSHPSPSNNRFALFKMYESVYRPKHYLAVDGNGLPYLSMMDEIYEPDPGALFMRVME